MSQQQKSFWGGSIVTALMMIVMTAVLSWGGVNIQQNRDARVQLPMVEDKIDSYIVNQTLQNKAVLDGIQQLDLKNDTVLRFVYENRADIKAEHEITRACQKDIVRCEELHNVH